MYVDNLLSEGEMLLIHNHLKGCKSCHNIVEMFIEEQQFIQETLQYPELPGDFADNIIDQLKPYPPKKRMYQSKRVIGLAAGVLLAVGLTTTLNPSFADWVEGLFSSDQVDEGLRMANEAGVVDRVNQTVMDQGISFKIEDVMADSTRLALSYQVLNEKGDVMGTVIELDDNNNKVSVRDANGNPLEITSMGWSGGSSRDYGLLEISLKDQNELEEVVIAFDLTLINGKEGSWKLEVPVNLKESQKMTTVVQLNEYKNSFHGIDIQMKEARFAPSSSEIMYETKFSSEERTLVERQAQAMAKEFGKENNSLLTNYGSALQYHIENEEGKTVSEHNTFVEGKGHPTDTGMIQGSGQETGEWGQNAWSESFVPRKDEGKLTYVLDGVIKTVPSDFSIKIKPSEIEKKTVSLEYEGNYMTIKKAGEQTNYSLRKSLWPIQKENVYEIQMEGGKEWLSSDLGAWVLVDEKGNSYEGYSSGSILDEKDENGRFKTTIKLSVYGLTNSPEELTLHLLSVTRYLEVKEKWRVPLYVES